MIFGYMRISTQKESQKTDRQRLTLEQYAKENNFKFDELIEERVSGTVKAENREEYKVLKGKLRSEDILVISDLDRLGRDADNVIMELKDLKAKGIKVVALDMPYMNEWNRTQDNSLYDMVIDIVITIKAHMAQQEREKIVSRINQGLDVARAKGKRLGRPKSELPKDFIKYYSMMNENKISKVEMSKLLGISRQHVYRLIKEYEEDIQE